MKQIIKYLVLFSFVGTFLLSCDILEDFMPQSEEAANKKQQKENDKKFESQWSLQERERANSAKDVAYLSEEEKEVYYYLNLARINPSLFGRTYAKAFDGTIGYTKGYAFDERKESLLQELAQMDSLPVLKPSELLFESADCFATEGGKQGIVGHDRSSTGCAKLNVAECCHYGGCYTGLGIVMSLLVDAGEKNESLGHRRICLSNSYNFLGVAIRKHKKYEKTAVLDFSREEME